MSNLVRVWGLDCEAPSAEAVSLLLCAYGLLEEMDWSQSRILRCCFTRTELLEAIGYSIPALTSALCKVPGGQAELSREMDGQSGLLQDLYCGIMFEFPIRDRW